MPRMDSDTILQNGDPNAAAKLLLIADGKMGKTHYAGMAAAAGFNVLYFDGDVARATIKSLPLEARKRIFLCGVGDTMLAGARSPAMWENLKEFTSSTVFRWNDTEQRIAKRTDPATDEIWAIKPGRLDTSCVFVLDSWTSFTESVTLAAAIENNVDLNTATTSDMRPVYQMAATKATQMLMLLRSMRCHIICLAHPDEFSHMTKPEGRRVKDIKELDLKVDWTKMIPKSTSKPHGLQLAKYFTDVAWMEISPAGERRINFKLDNGRVSGGHFDGVENTETYSFANLVKAVGGVMPNPKVMAPYDHWLQIIEPGAAPAESQPAQVLDGTQPATAVKVGGGMSGLFKKPA